MTLEQIVGTILIRDRFRQERYVYLARLFAGAALLLALSVWANVSLASRDPIHRYLMTDEVWKLRPPLSLDQPGLTDQQVQDWTTDAVSRIYTFDFVNYRSQLQNAQNYLTGAGWRGFEKALKDSGNFNAVIRNRFVLTAAPTGPARIVGKTKIDAGDGTMRFAWKIEFPLLLTYRSSVATTTQDLSIQVVVGRMPQYVFPSGLGIRSIRAQ